MSTAESNPRRDPLNILLLEDSNDDAVIIQTYLESLESIRAKVFCCETTQAALELIELKNFDLILADLTLPDSSGTETIKRLAADLDATPIVVISSQPDLKTELEILQLGTDAFLSKDIITPDALLKIINTFALNNRASHEIDTSEQNNFQSILNANLDSILVIDQNGIVRFINRAGLRLFNVNPSQIVGFHFGTPITNEPVELSILNDHIPRATVEMGISKIPWKGSRAYLASFRDITTRKNLETRLRQSQERLDLALSAGGLAIWDWNIETNTYYLNDQFANILGIPHSESYSQEEWLNNLINPEDLPIRNKQIRDHMSGLVDYYESQHRMKTPDNDWIWVHEKGQVTERDSQNNPLRLICICHDITYKKKQEDEQLRAAKLEALGLLAGGIAHDLNNILMAIDLNLDIALEEFSLNLEQREIIVDTHNASNRARELSHRLLAFSKGGATDPRIVRVQETVQDAVEFALRGANLRPVFAFGPNLPNVYVDLGQFQQVIDNLVINARDACKEGGKLAVKARSIQIDPDQGLKLRPGKYVRIDIIDYGPGIPEDILKKIFDPYFTTKEHGNGIGLPTCYAILKRNQGIITVKSEVGKGTCFSLYFPETQHAEPSKPIVLQKQNNLSGRVLVIDDELSIRRTVEQTLCRSGLDVVTAETGQEGIAEFEKRCTTANSFDVVLLDGIIPDGLGGEHALNRLLEIDPFAKVILFSGYTESNYANRWKDKGFIDRLVKPCSSQEITSAIERALNCNHSTQDGKPKDSSGNLK
ncbi:MAG: response regulator [Verrucomicrobiota bacterium]